MRIYVMEALGTFFLVLTMGLSGNPFGVGLILMAWVYFGAHISGAHYNPAVSFAFYLKKEISVALLFKYFVSQVTGAIIAAFVVLLISRVVFYVEPPTITNLYQQASVEILMTFVFVYIMLFVTKKGFSVTNHAYGLIVGLTFSGMLIIGDKISGGIYNPALSIGTSVIDYLTGGASYKAIPLYTLAPCLGASLAAWAFNYFER